MTRIADPQIHFADMEFLTQGIDLDPILKRISEFLDDQPRWSSSSATIFSGV